MMDPRDLRFLRRAVAIAARGEGLVEPNPMVGCVLARGETVLGEGWHERHGGPHAEVNALAAAQENGADAARGATAYVSLEPCCHTGKTPPCTRALLAAGVARVVVAARDPFPQVDGGGIDELRGAGVEVTVASAAGLGDGGGDGGGDEAAVAAAAADRIAPFAKLVTTGRPWVLAKWAMTLDGKIATRTGSSQWISSEASRAIVHRIRGRVDAIVVGRGTAIADDPRLTARPPGVRTATRVVLGAPARGGRLIATAGEAPLLIFAKDQSEAESLGWAVEAGAEVLAVEPHPADAAPCPAENPSRFAAMLDELGRRRMTNVLVEGGAGVLGAAFDAGQIDEVHIFIGPKIIGGQPAPSPIGGAGVEAMTAAAAARDLAIDAVGGDVYLHGRLGGSAGQGSGT